MTAATLTHLPLAAGGALAHSAGRALLWSVERYMRAPLGHTAIAALTTFSLIAGANALYLQDGMHPAPMFGGTTAKPVVAAPAPVIPAVRTDRPIVRAPSPETTGSVPRVTENPIGNAEVQNVQRRLQALGLFDERVDGLYGPRTARAIRTFEERLGMRPRGELTREVMQRILSTSTLPVATREPVASPALPIAPAPVSAPVAPGPSATPVTPAATYVPQPQPQAPIVVAPQAVAPASLAATVSPMTVGTISPPAETRELRRDLPASPGEAFEIATEAAEEAFDTIVGGVQTVMMSRPAAQPLPEKPIEPLPLVTAALPEAAVAAMALVTPEPFSPNDRDTVAKVQRGLSSLGFLHGPVDGVAGEATAKAIRNFEVYYSYGVTGSITPDLLRLLVEKGATI